MTTFTNMATLSYNGNTVNSNVVTGQIRATVTVTKTAVRDNYTAGENVAYLINIVNTGTTALTNLTLKDDLGAYTASCGTVYPLTYVAGTVHYFVNGVEQATPTVTAGPPLTITGISVPAGGNVSIAYEAAASAYAPLAEGATIVNTVTLTGSCLTAPLTAEETITVRYEAALAITKTLSPTVVQENGQITYTFTIQNFGNAAATAATDVVLADTFDPKLTIQSVTFNGTVWTQGNQYHYDAGTGQFVTSTGQITVPAATFTQEANGTWTTTPGTATLIVTGTV